jgi:hypothetical protein
MMSNTDRLVKYLIQSSDYSSACPTVGDTSVSRLYVDLSGEPASIDDRASIYRDSMVERTDETERVLAARWIIASLDDHGFTDWEVYETEAEYREAWARCEAEFEGIDWDSI